MPQMKPNMSGRDVLSIGLPVINYTNRPEYYKEQYVGVIEYNPDDIKLDILNGNVKTGTLDGSSIGQLKQNSMFRSIQYTHGNRTALDTAFNLQQIASSYLAINGGSVGLTDVLPSVDTIDKLDQYVAGRLAKTSLITEQVLRGAIIPPIGMTTDEFVDIKYADAITPDQELFNICLSNLDLTTNGFYAMTSSGSKASDDHMLSIVASKGQISIGPTRIAQLFTYKRTTPHFPQFSHDPLSRGYVADSYMRGLRPQSVVFDCMAARHGFIQIALKTSVVGHQARKNRKCLELHVINNLHQLSKGNRIVQPSYGGDGFDCTKLLRVFIPLVDITDAEFATHNHDDAEFARMTHYRRQFIDNIIHINRGFNFGGDATREMPFKLDQIYRDIQSQNKSGRPTKAAIAMVHTFAQELPYIYTSAVYRLKHKPAHIHIMALQSVIGYVYLGMSFSELMRNSIPDNILPSIFAAIRQYCCLAFVPAGTAIGQLSALAISEPWVQYTLHSKRRAGITTGTQTDKLTRMIEILSAKSTSAMIGAHMVLHTVTPMTMFAVQKLANQIHETLFEHLVESYCDLYDPSQKLAYGPYMDEQAAVLAYLRVQSPMYALSDFCCRFVLNRNALNFRNISITHLTNILATSGVYPIAMNINAKSIVFRTYIYLKSIDTHDIMRSISATREYIMGQLVSGIIGISRTYVSSIVKPVLSESGKITMEKVNYITTDGSNLAETLFNFPEIDPHTSTSDSIEEITQLYGVNAGVQKMISELYALNSSVHLRHYMEIADELGFTGTITSSDSGGIKHREPNDILLSAGISDAVRVLTKGAVSSITNKMDSVTSNLLLGQLPRIGTHYNDICLNEQFITDNRHATLDDF
jgi:DNA-directed RNA polymerase beta' subunit